MTHNKGISNDDGDKTWQNFGTSFTISYTKQKHYHLRTYMACANQPHPQFQQVILGVKGRDCTGLAQVSCTVMYAYVAPHTLVGAWSMSLGLRRHIE